jgi:hypothetical protein
MWNRGDCYGRKLLSRCRKVLLGPIGPFSGSIGQSLVKNLFMHENAQPMKGGVSTGRLSTHGTLVILHALPGRRQSDPSQLDRSLWCITTLSEPFGVVAGALCVECFEYI